MRRLPPTVWSFLAALALLLAWGHGSADAEDAPAPKPPRNTLEAAQQFAAAFAARDETRMQALAGSTRHDAWFTLDWMLSGDAYDAANAWAARVGSDAHGMAKYIEAHRASPVPGPERRRLNLVKTLRNKGDIPGVLAHADRLPETLDSLPAIEFWWLHARALDRARKPGPSFEAVERAAAGARALGARSIEARIEATRADIATRAGRFDLRLQARERQLELAKLRAPRASVGGAMINLGHALRDVGRFEEAAARFLDGQARAETDGHPVFVSHARAGLASTREAQGRFRDAMQLRKTDIAFWAARPLDTRLASRRNALGNLHRRMGNWRDAAKEHEAALAIYIELESHRSVPGARNNLALDYRAGGRLAKAHSLLERALEEAPKTQAGLLVETNIRGNLGRVLLDLGEVERATTLFERARTDYARMGQTSQVVAIDLKLAELHRVAGRHAEAIGILERAQGAAEGRTSRSEQLEVAAALAAAHGAAGDHERAEKLLRGCLDRLPDELPTGVAALLWSNLGDTLRYRKRYEEARTAYGRAAEIATALDIADTSVGALNKMAWLAFEAERFDEAVRLIRRATTWLPRLRSGMAEDTGARAGATWNQVFMVGYFASVRAKDPGAAFEMAESARAYGLLEALGGALAVGSALLPPALHERRIEAEAQEARAAQGLDRARRSRDLRRIRKAEKALEAARAQVDDVAKAIQRESKLAAEVVYPESITLAEAQAALAKDEVLLYTIADAENTRVFLVTKDGTHDDWLGPTRAFRDQARSMDVSDPEVDAAPALAALKKHVVDVLELPASVRRILVVAQDAAAYLPLAAAYPDRQIVQLASMTSHVALKARRDQAAEGVLAVGDPAYPRGSRLPRLHASADEVRAIGTTTLLGKDATEAGLRAALVEGARRRALHVACHGYADESQPFRSWLALTPTKDSDGYLRVPEIMQLPLDVGTVVLSACETGRGRVFHGEGVVGLARAFLVAGAGRVVCSLWKVDDEATGVLMKRFYELWQPKEGKGLPVAEALRQAQQHVRSMPKWKHPHYWAAWVVWE